MTNHVHLVVVPQSESALASTLKPVHLRYAQHVNRTRGVTGRIWHGRFYSCPLDDVHTQAAMRYVEMNPVRARLVRRAEDYTWSSAPAHCGLRPDPLLADISGLRCSAGIEDWSAWLGSGLDDETLKHLRLHSRTGRPLGSDSFVDRLERLSSRVLRPRRAGRPRGRKSG
jgi:putative transposase